MITSGYIWPMPTYFTGQEIALGDWVKVYVPGRGVWHHGIVGKIYLACDDSGLEEIEASYERGLIADPAFNPVRFAVEIAHNMKATGVTVSNWDDFADGNQIFLRRKASSEQHVQEILARVEANIRKPYNLLGQNCEHFASYAFTGQAESKSIQALGAIAGLAVVAGILFKGTSRDA